MKWGLFNKEEIVENGDLYLERWRVIDTPWFKFFVHKFHRPDADRHLHDHPWNFTTFILSNGYVEELLEKEIGIFSYRVVRKPFRFVRHKAEDYHRVYKFNNPERPAWTLFFCGKRRREWGFLTENGWVNNKDYINDREKSNNE